MPWIHIDDAVGIILHAIDNAAVEGPINTVAPQQITNAQYTAAFARALSRPAIFPGWFFREQLLQTSPAADIRHAPPSLIQT